MSKRSLFSGLTAFFLISSIVTLEEAGAIQPTPQQIQAFNALSQQEKENLARQLGVSIPQSSIPVTTSPTTQTVSVQPRLVSAEITEQKPAATTTKLSNQIKAFGYDLFAGIPSSFAPVNDIPVSSDYILGPGDSLKVDVYGKENRSYELAIDTEGKVSIPELGPLQIAGNSFSEAKRLIDLTFKQKVIGVNANVSMGALRSIRVFVLGEAYQPGSYVVSSLSTMTNALVLSGGIAETGSLRNVQLKRKGELVQTLDLYDLLLSGDTSSDAQLKSGDVVFIPPVGETVTVKGEVRRPARYELKGIQYAREAVKLAGGLTSDAFPKLSTIRRATDRDDYKVIEVNIAGDLGNSLKLDDGDEITIPSRLTKTNGLITLSGHLLRSGERNWQKSLRLSDLIPNVEALKSSPDIDFGLIERVTAPTDEIELLPFSLRKAWADRGSASDLLVWEKDTIHVLSSRGDDRVELMSDLVSKLREQASIDVPSKEVSIAGSVRFSGTYPLLEGMTVADLIVAAGGLTEQAYALRAELSRSTLGSERRIKEDRFDLNLSQSDSLSFSLQPRDSLQIKDIPDWSGSGSITIQGEVQFPGVYSITKNDTLASLVERAGGVTRYAYVPGAVFSRRELKAQQAEQLQALQNRLSEDLAKAQLVEANSTTENTATGDIAEAQELLAQLKQTDAVGRLVIDLAKVISKADGYEIPLQDGDQLMVPSKKNSVTIVGEVQLPISQIYDENLDYWDYISRSGGVTESADEARIYVIKADGAVQIPQRSNWFADSRGQISPGDTIVVPLDADKVDQVILWRDLSQIFYQIALGAAAVGSL